MIKFFQNIFSVHGFIFLTLIMFGLSAGQLTYDGCADLAPGDFEKAIIVGQTTDTDLQEPTKINLDKEGNVYISLKKKGEIWKIAGTHYNLKKVLGKIPIYNEKFHGLLGFALSENFLEDGWIYTLSSPLEVNDPGSINPQYGIKDLHEITFRLSRFTIKNDSLDLTSEKIIMEVPTQVMEGHQGGDVIIENGMLYFTTGNDSWAIQSPTPNTDEADESRNALRSSANTNDLRGKVIKIKLKNLPESHPKTEWGAGVSYEIPEDNLFKPGTEKTRSEIFAMGLRNPYTLFVDQGRVYVADVGPQGSSPNEHGPSGGDQFYISDVGANFGYPMFVNGIEPCKILDAQKNILGEYDPEEPRNTSIFNTGLELLPKPVPAAAIRSHDQSKNIEGWFRAGSMSLMAGPVYHYDGSNKSPDKFPPHFDGKWIVGDYTLPNLKAVITEGNEVVDMVTLFDHINFNGPLGMRFGPDGALYVVEYSNVWNGFNAGTQVSRVRYTGDCHPDIPVPIGQGVNFKPPVRHKILIHRSKLNLPPKTAGVKLYGLKGNKLWEGMSTGEKNKVQIPASLINKLVLAEFITDEELR